MGILRGRYDCPDPRGSPKELSHSSHSEPGTPVGAAWEVPEIEVTRQVIRRPPNPRGDVTDWLGSCMLFYLFVVSIFIVLALLPLVSVFTAIYGATG